MFVEDDEELADVDGPRMAASVAVDAGSSVDVAPDTACNLVVGEPLEIEEASCLVVAVVAHLGVVVSSG